MVIRDNNSDASQPAPANVHVSYRISMPCHRSPSPQVKSAALSLSEYPTRHALYVKRQQRPHRSDSVNVQCPSTDLTTHSISLSLSLSLSTYHYYYHHHLITETSTATRTELTSANYGRLLPPVRSSFSSRISIRHCKSSASTRRGS